MKKSLPLLGLAAAFVLVLQVTAFASPYVYYEKKESEALVNGVTYTEYKQATTEGLRDIYVLTVDITNPNLSIAPVDSQKDYGLKETVKTLLQDSGAIAGVNGDFFGMAGSYSASFGPVVSDSTLISLNAFVNRQENNYASFYIGDDNNPFILYLKPEITFSAGGDALDIASINKITDMVFPVCINREAMEDTKALDERFPGLYKIVVENDVITYVTKQPETVTVPENGYIITMNSITATYSLQNFPQGQNAKLTIKAGVDFNKLKTAIGGGGRILLNGETVTDTGQVARGKQPRTAIGIKGDKSAIVLITVDGRSHSIGATHEDMANLMRRFGCNNAMHLDGGGSSTMAVTGQDGLTVVNTPSDGIERKVINAVGIFDNAPTGSITQIKIEATERGFKSAPVRLNIYGLDEHLHKIEIPPEDITLATSDDATLKGEFLYPGATGNITVTASYQNFTAETTVAISDAAKLTGDRSSMTLSAVGDRQTPTFTAENTNGESAYVYSSGINYEVFPPELGHVEFGTFIADSPGLGYMKCSLGGAAWYIDISVGTVSRVVTSFEGKPEASFIGYPAAVTGSVSYTPDHTAEADTAVKLSYRFDALTDTTQAAYYEFASPIQFQKNPTGFKLHVYGNESGHWLRMKLTDADNKSVVVDLAKNVDWTGYKEVEAKLPAGVKYPVTLDRIYIASIGTEEAADFTLYFDYLVAVFPQDGEKPAHPASTTYEDPWLADLSAKSENALDIAIVSDILLPKSDRKAAIISGVMDRIKSAAPGLAILAGEADPEDPNLGIATSAWQGTYSATVTGNTKIIQMTAAKGGLLSTDAAQWNYLQQDILTNKNTVIITDKSPVNYTYTQEYKLLNGILSQAAKDGRSIIVISTEGTTNWVKAANGIRYVNLGGLLKSNGELNTDFKVLKLRVTDDGIKYQFR